MPKSTYVANVMLFDGRTMRKRQGVLFGTEGIEWVGAHARAPRGASGAREVDGAGKTLMPGLIDVHVHLQFDGSADFEKESKELTTPGHAAITPTTAAAATASGQQRTRARRRGLNPPHPHMLSIMPAVPGGP